MKTIQFLQKEIPVIGMGTWFMGEGKKPYEEELHAMRTGIEEGIQLIDTAEMYGEGLAEKLVGDAMSYYDREKLTIVTKVYPWNATKEKMHVSLENSLRRLQTDYVDLYLLHWREEVPLEESVEAILKLQQQGKIKHWGVSNYDVDDLKELVHYTSTCATNQVLYHLGSRGIEYALKPYMDELQIPLMAYSPLGHGNHAKHLFKDNEVLQQIAIERDVTIEQILLAWVIAQNETIAIPKASSEQNMRANIEAAKIVLTHSEIDALNFAFPAPSKKVPLDEL